MPKHAGPGAVNRWEDPTGRLEPSWRSWIPAAFVVFSLLALLITPPVLDSRIDALRDDVVAPAQEARGLINDIRHAFSRAEAAIRGLLLAGEDRFLVELREAQEEERRAFAQLRPISTQLDPALARQVEELNTQALRAHTARAALLRNAVARRASPALLVEEDERHERLLASSADVKAAIVERIADARERIRGLERTGTAMTLLLALLALVSALLVMWIGRQFRSRALEEAELRAAALALAEATQVEEVLRRIVSIAAHAPRGESSYVERLDTGSGTVEVVAAAGDAAPPVGSRAPFPGSLTEELIRTGGPEIVPDLCREDRPMSRLLGRTDSRCAALVVPLVAEEEVLGALVVIRARESFRASEIPKQRVLGVLVALALRNAVLLQQAQEQHGALKRVVQSRERLIRGFGHDVKNPLGAADGYAQILEEGVVGELSPEQKRSASRIRASVRSALELIEKLIELARAEAGQLEAHRVEVDIAGLAGEIAEEYRAQARTAGLELRCELPPTLPPIESDPQRIRQVLSNLLSNAIKYTPEGGLVRVSAAVRAGRRMEDPTRWMTVAVSDTGPGIAEQQQDAMFEEFRRMEQDGVGGAGLGLAISERIARLLDGEITLESKVGEGSTFTLWLPCEPPPHESAAASS